MPSSPNSTQGGNNAPQVMIGLTQADALTLKKHCDVSRAQALAFLVDQGTGDAQADEESLRIMVNLMETYKRIGNAVTAGLED